MSLWLIILTALVLAMSIFVVFRFFKKPKKRKFPPGNYALLSVFDKTGIEKFAGQLVELGWYIISSGGTAKRIAAAGIPVIDVAELVGGGPILGDKVKTLSREVHAGLLADNSDVEIEELEGLGIPWIGLVCVDMYPLKDAIAKPDATLTSVMKSNDIGGPTMLRSATKGGRIIMCDPADREWIPGWIRGGMPDTKSTLRELAGKAEFALADYILALARFLDPSKYGDFEIRKKDV